MPYSSLRRYKIFPNYLKYYRNYLEKFKKPYPKYLFRKELFLMECNLLENYTLWWVGEITEKLIKLPFCVQSNIDLRFVYSLVMFKDFPKKNRWCLYGESFTFVGTYFLYNTKLRKLLQFYGPWGHKDNT